MKQYRVLTSGDVVAYRAALADTFLRRLRGLMKKNALPEGEGLILRPCNQVHTFGMRFAIDVVFLSRSGEILHIQPQMEPNCVTPFVTRAYQALELPAGTVRKKGLNNGLIIAFDFVNEV